MREIPSMLLCMISCDFIDLHKIWCVLSVNLKGGDSMKKTDLFEEIGKLIDIILGT